MRLTGGTIRMPEVVGSDWFGRPRPGTPARGFGQRVVSAAATCHGEFDFVVFTDIPRKLLNAVRDGVPAPGDRPDLDYVTQSDLAEIKEMLDWAKGDGTYRIHLVPVFEIFNAEN